MEMQSVKPAAKTEPTQKYLKVSEVKNDTIVLKDGGLRAVLAVSSTNFALKSEEEQNAIIAGYQNFLNSLEFPVQVLMHSRILDIEGYLTKLRGLASAQTNELLRIQMTEYIEYVAKLVEFANIMSKTFYVIVPYSARGEKKETFLGKVGNLFNPTAQITSHEEGFERAKIHLDERVSHVSSALGSIGLRSILLDTRELIELLYESYNFDTASPLHAESFEEIDLGGSDSNLRIPSQ